MFDCIFVSRLQQDHICIPEVPGPAGGPVTYMVFPTLLRPHLHRGKMWCRQRYYSARPWQGRMGELEIAWWWPEHEEWGVRSWDNIAINSFLCSMCSVDHLVLTTGAKLSLIRTSFTEITQDNKYPLLWCHHMPASLEIYKLLNFSQTTHFRQQAFVVGQAATGGLTGDESCGAVDNCL